MNIGILTLSIHGNYGGTLQNYALVTILKRMGFKVETIDYKNLRHQRIKIKIFRTLRFIGGKYCIKAISQISPKFALLYHIRTFADKYIPFTKVLSTPHKLKKIASKYDFLIVGSDQVWRKIFIYDNIGTYFFDFSKNIPPKKIAYAASIGTEKCEYNSTEISLINEYIKNFTAISVREDSSIHLIKNVFKWDCPNPELVLDPTLLLSRNDYISIIQKEKTLTPQKANLFYYILDETEEKKSCIDFLSEELNLYSYSIYSTNQKSLLDILRTGYTQKIEQWLSSIYHTDFIITDSFHGMVFSIIFHKQFLVYANKERGLSRFTSLLKLLNLENRIFFSLEELKEKEIWKESINYEKIDNILSHYQQESFNFLKRNLL